jgi:MinD-like ATPase involved in chromosome partitioning or flagellar assembly
VGDLEVVAPALSAESALAPVAGPRFNRLGGPLVAVCGLAGGAGTSTLALALARQAARHSSVPVLLTEVSPECGGLAVLAGRAAPLCLRELARQLDAGEQPTETFVELDGGPRLVAGAPHAAPTVEPEPLRRVLAAARAEHGLVVVDCGQPSRDQACVLDQASQIVWTLPASPSAIHRARVLFASGVLPPPGAAREALVANAIQPSGSARVRELRRLAEHRCDRLALVPHSRRLAQGDLAGLDDLADAVAAIAGLIPEAS